MAINQLNQTTNAVYIPTIIAQKSLGRFASYMNLAKTVTRDFELAPATFGKTIRVPKRGTVTAYQKTAGEVVTRQNPTATDVAVTLDQHWETTIMIDDVTKVFENQDTLNGYADDCAIQLAEKVESKLAQLHTSITNSVRLDTTSDSTIEGSIITCRERLIMNKVPKLEAKNAYIHPSVMSRLLKIPRFTEKDKLGSTAIPSGAIGSLHGINFFESQLVETSGSPVAYHNLVYTRNAIVLASRPLPQAPAGMGARQVVVQNEDIGMGLRATWSYDPNYLGLQITLDILFGVALLDDRCIVELESF